MTPTHIMLTEQGFVAMPNNVLFAPEEQEKVRRLAHEIGFLPDGVEVEIRTFTSSDCNKSVTCGINDHCFQSDCGKGYCDNMGKSFAYLKTKEVKEESQDQIIEDLIATWQSGRWNDSDDEYSEVKRKFKVTRI